MASGQATSRRAPPFIDPTGYARHCPGQTLLINSGSSTCEQGISEEPQIVR